MAVKTAPSFASSAFADRLAQADFATLAATYVARREDLKEANRDDRKGLAR
jgi:cytochrome c553